MMMYSYRKVRPQVLHNPISRDTIKQRVIKQLQQQDFITIRDIIDDRGPGNPLFQTACIHHLAEKKIIRRVGSVGPDVLDGQYTVGPAYPLNVLQE